MSCNKCTTKIKHIINNPTKISINGIIQEQNEKDVVNINIPTKTSDLINDSGFGQGGSSSSVLDGVQQNGNIVPIVNKYAIIETPTKTSDLENDSDFTTKDYVDQNSTNLSNLLDEKLEEFSDTYVPTLSNIFLEDNVSDIPSMKSISDWMGTSKEINVIGSELTGNLIDTSLPSVLTGTLISNISCKSKTNSVLKSVGTNFTVGGTFKIAITDFNNTIVWVSNETYSAGTGWQITNIENREIAVGETVWLYLINSSPINIRFSENGAIPSENLIQKGAQTNTIINGSQGSYYSLYFTVESNIGGGVLKDYLLKTDSEEYVESKNLETFGSVSYNTSIPSRDILAYYILKIPFIEDKVVKNINMHCSSSGAMQMVIGELDQENKFIENSSFTVNVTNGNNTIKVDKFLRVGQYLGIKTPNKMSDINTNLQHNYSWAVENSYTSPLTQVTSWSLAISLDVVSLLKNDKKIASVKDIEEINNKINSIELDNIIKSPNGTTYRIRVSDSGDLYSEAVGVYSKILHFGNSILKHNIVSYWWGNWGMAASTRENDYAHRFLSKIRVSNPVAESWEENIAEWELNPVGYNKAQLDSILTAQTYDLIIIRLGENATATPVTTYKTAFRDLVDYIQDKVPTARVVIGGMFWMNIDLDNAMREVANEKGLTFSDMSGLEIPSNKSYIGDVVTGDDGQNHTVDNQGVANHPNDSGMEAIGTRLFNSL